MKLADLAPRLEPYREPDQHGMQSLTFLCPKCRHQEIQVYIWAGRYTDVEVDHPILGKVIRRVWHAEQGPHRDWATLSLTPSINREGLGDKCGGWHGYITNGEIVGGLA